MSTMRAKSSRQRRERWRNWLKAGSATVVLSLLCGGVPVAAEERGEPARIAEEICEAADQSPICAFKTFWGCAADAVATCRDVGIATAPPRAPQVQDDGLVTTAARLRPWTLSWPDLIAGLQTEIASIRAVTLRHIAPRRFNGARHLPFAEPPTTEATLKATDLQGRPVTQSVFLAPLTPHRWRVVGFATWGPKNSAGPCDIGPAIPKPGCPLLVTGLSAP